MLDRILYSLVDTLQWLFPSCGLVRPNVREPTGIDPYSYRYVSLESHKIAFPVANAG
jgi:hypothetical protein